MKFREPNADARLHGFYISDLTRGFWGFDKENQKILEKVGTTKDKLPFSVCVFLKARKIHWRDRKGNVVTLSYKIKPDQIECFGSYLGKKKSLRVFREWSAGEDDEMIHRLESEAIGKLCMECIDSLL